MLPELNRECRAHSRKNRHRIQNTKLHNVDISACSQNLQLTCVINNTRQHVYHIHSNNQQFNTPNNYGF